MTGQHRGCMLGILNDFDLHVLDFMRPSVYV